MYQYIYMCIYNRHVCTATGWFAMISLWKKTFLSFMLISPSLYIIVHCSCMAVCCTCRLLVYSEFVLFTNVRHYQHCGHYHNITSLCGS